MDIINCISDTVYWIDINCNLIGCNNNFIKLLGLNELNDIKGTPYHQMKNHAQWPEERVESLKLDDMSVIFSGKSQYQRNEKPFNTPDGKSLHFKITRVPMQDEQKNIIGLIVVLSEIPVQDNQVAAATEEKTITKKAKKTKKSAPSVLMIEDNMIAQNVEKALLTALNCQVDIAETGDKALELFNPGKYDLVLMDIDLQDTSGYAVAKQLRKKEKNTNYHVPIIALTTFEADIVKYDCEQYFMEGAISKPLTSEQAEQLVKHYIYHVDTSIPGLKSIDESARSKIS